MTYRSGERRRCMDAFFVCIVAFAPTALWAAALTSNGNGFDASAIAGQVASTNRGFIDSSRANVSLADPGRTATNGASLIHTVRYDLPPTAMSSGARGTRAGGLSSAAPAIKRIGQRTPLRAIAAASVAGATCAAANTTDPLADPRALSLADCRGA